MSKHWIWLQAEECPYLHDNANNSWVNLTEPTGKVYIETSYKNVST